MNNITITKTTPIILYGGGFKAHEMLLYLRKNIFNVLCILDEKPDDPAFTTDLPMYSPTAYELSLQTKKESIVIITINDVFEHKKIVDKLSTYGFKYFLYKNPENECLKEMNTFFDNFYNYKKLLGVTIPEYKKENNRISKKIILEKTEECVTALVPIELLFAMPSENIENLPTGKSEYVSKMGKSIIYFLYCYHLIEAFEIGIEAKIWEPYINSYYKFSVSGMKNSEDVRKENFRKYVVRRFKIFEKMNELYCTQPNFFHNNPIIVKWNKAGYFNIYDGQNRTAFLMVKGVKYIACKMSNECFRLWENQCALKELLHYLKDNKVVMDFPILNPYFLLNEDLNFKYNKILIDYFRYFSQEEIEICNNRILCYRSEVGYYAQQFTRMGGDVIIHCANNKNRKLIEFLNKLYYLKEKIEIINEAEEQILLEKSYYIVFVEENLKNFDQDQMQQLEKLTKKYLCIKLKQNKKVSNWVLKNLNFRKAIKINTILLEDELIDLWIFIK